MGLKSSATMMFGQVETIEDRIEHLGRIREQQDRSGGFTAFICWTFQPQHTILKVKHPTGVAEYLRTQALARIFLDNIDNIQAPGSRRVRRSARSRSDTARTLSDR